MADPVPSEKTILVVDDEPEICAFFETILLRYGFKVVTVPSGDKALNLLKSDVYEHVDLVLLDLMMPGTGGYNALKELQSPDYKNVPVIIITARALDQNTVAEMKMESNVRGFFTKPPDFKALRKLIYEILEIPWQESAGGFNSWDKF